MHAVVYQGPGQVTVDTVEAPEIETPTDAIVRTRMAGLCGSDMHIYHGEQAGLLPGDTIGHELVGTVEAVGEAVTGIAPGDEVVSSFQIPCMACRACRREAYNACQDLQVYGHGLAMGSLNGAQAELVRVPRAHTALWLIPQGVSRTEALLAGDVLAAAYTGVRPWIAPGDTVAVVGCGPVGLMAMEVATTLGAGQVLGIELSTDRLTIVEERGHTALDPAQCDPVASVMEATEDHGADLVIEAVGGQGQALETALSLVGPGGHLTALGVPTEYSFDYPWLETFSKGASFQSTLANVPRWIDEVLALQAAGRLETEWLVSHRMPLDEAAEAYRMFDDQEALKVVLEP